MGASGYFLIATLTALGVSFWRSSVSRDCAMTLLLWYVLANLAYEYGRIEEISTQINGIIFCATCLWLTRKHDNHWLPWSLIVCCSFTMAFTALYDGDAYTFKAIKNSVYIVQLLLLAGSWRG